jgi:hypothetical protein
MSDQNENEQGQNGGNNKSFKDLLDRFSGTPSKGVHVKDSAEPDLLRNILREREEDKK